MSWIALLSFCSGYALRALRVPTVIRPELGELLSSRHEPTSAPWIKTRQQQQQERIP